LNAFSIFRSVSEEGERDRHAGLWTGFGATLELPR
jgi:hypothetical protein